MQEVLSVEIYRDVDFPDIDVDVARLGIDCVNAITKNLQIIRDSRKIRIVKGTIDVVDSKAVHWPRFEANLNVILTNRDLIANANQSSDIGRTIGFNSPLAQRNTAVSLVSASSIDPWLTTAHETGHMLNLRYPENAQDELHCTIDECLMGAVTTKVTSLERVKKGGINGWLERNGWREADYVEHTHSTGTSFCNDCVDQLARRSFFRLQHMQGKHIPESLR